MSTKRTRSTSRIKAIHPHLKPGDMCGERGHEAASSRPVFPVMRGAIRHGASEGPAPTMHAFPMHTIGLYGRSAVGQCSGFSPCS